MFRYKLRNFFEIFHVVLVMRVTTTKSTAIHNYQLESGFT